MQIPNLKDSLCQGRGGHFKQNGLGVLCLWRMTD